MAFDMTMEIYGVEFPIINYSLEIENKNGGNKTTKMGRISVLKPVDTSSSVLMNNLIAGKSKASKAKITASQGKNIHVQYDLTDAWVEAILISGSKQEKRFAESVMVRFAKMDFTPDKGKKASYDAATHSPVTSDSGSS